jgi:lysophospholipase L1-like esterase
MATIPSAYPSGGGLTTAYPDQAPAQEHGLTAGTYPATGNAAMLNLAVALANRNTTRVDIPVIGDSMTEGQGATTFTARWVAQANRAIRNYYPTVTNGHNGGLGFIPIASTGETSYTWPVSVTGSPFSTDLGPVRACTSTGSSTTWTWTAPSGTTSVQIMYYDGPFPGEFSYQVGSGAVIDVSNTNTLTDLLTAPILISGGQVLTIAWVSNNVNLDGLVHFAGDEASGVTLHGCGHYGWGAWATGAGNGSPAWNTPELSALNWAQCFANGFPNLAAIGIQLAGNDSAVTVGNFTAAQFQANMLAFIATLQDASPAIAKVPIFFNLEYQIALTPADPGGWPAYMAALRNVQAATPNSHVVADFNYRMPSVASNWNGGELYADVAHPTNLGHALMGEIVAAGMLIQ